MNDRCWLSTKSKDDDRLGIWTFGSRMVSRAPLNSVAARWSVLPNESSIKAHWGTRFELFCLKKPVKSIAQGYSAELRNSIWKVCRTGLICILAFKTQFANIAQRHSSTKYLRGVSGFGTSSRSWSPHVCDVTTNNYRELSLWPRGIAI